MTMITRIDPFRELASLFENFADGAPAKDQLMAGSFVPPVDVYEDEHNLVLKLEIPGINEESAASANLKKKRKKRTSIASSGATVLLFAPSGCRTRSTARSAKRTMTKAF